MVGVAHPGSLPFQTSAPGSAAGTPAASPPLPLRCCSPPRVGFRLSASSRDTVAHSSLAASNQARLKFPRSLTSSAFLEFIYILAVLNLGSQRYRLSYLRKQVSRTYAGFLDASFRWHDGSLLPECVNVFMERTTRYFRPVLPDTGKSLTSVRIAPNLPLMTICQWVFSSVSMAAPTLATCS